MQCTFDETFRRDYPNNLQVLFLSKSGTTVVDTLLGARQELERLCDATASPTNRELRPITSLSSIKKVQNFTT